MKKSKILERIVAGLNQELTQREDITIRLAASAEEDMNYKPDQKTVYISYNVFTEHQDQYIKRFPAATTEEASFFAEEVLTYFTFHEVGHALIDLYTLPIVGNEETATDNLATIISLEYYGKQGFSIIINAAEAFDIFSEEKGEVNEEAFQSEHAPDRSRLYNILCLAYGFDPEAAYTEIEKINNKEFIEFLDKKKEYCKEEYPRQKESWLQLLEPHLRQQADEESPDK